MAQASSRIFRAAIAVSLLLISAPACAGFQIITDFTQEITSTDRKEGQTRGISNGSIRSLGFSWRPRWTKTLLERHERQIELLLGPYFRLPTLISLTGFGTSISSLFMWEVGFDAGISWFGYAKTTFTVSPLSRLSYTGSSASTSGGEIAYSVSGSGFGFRLDVPIFRLESDPGDQKVEIGASVGYHFFTISKISAEAVNFTPSGSEAASINNPLIKTQEADSRLLFGVFLNVRL